MLVAAGRPDKVDPQGKYIIETLAGGGAVGDDGPATRARLSLPGGVTVDRDGNLVIVDFGNHRVREVNRHTQRIRTIAGTGQAGYSGDGGPGILARLARPENAAFGPDGSLYIVDTHNHSIRRLDARTAAISTFAGNGHKGFAGDGGPAARAQFYQPEGIAFDGGGNCYIGDTLNGRIRRIDARSGLITTVAGDGRIGTSPDGTPGPQASFMRLARLAADAEGNVYIADSPSQRIQMLDAATGQLHTLAGTGESGFGGDNGPATAARLSYPEGVALDSRNNIYIADLGNHRVRRIERSTGVITTIAGSGRPGFCGDAGKATEACLWSPGRIAVDADSNVYVCDILNARVRRIDRSTGLISTVAGTGDLGDGGPARDALLAIPGDLAYAEDRLYVAEYGNRRVRAIDLEKGTIITVAGGGTGSGDNLPATSVALGLPEAIAVRGNDLFIADSLANTVWRVDLSKGWLSRFAGNGDAAYSGDGASPAFAGLRNPGAVAVASDGTVFIADFGNECIRYVEADGRTIRTLRGRVGDRESFHGPVMSMFALGRTLYWVLSGSTDVFAFDIASRELKRMAFPAGISGLNDIWVRERKLFAADTLAHQVFAIDLDSGAVTRVAGNGTQGLAGDGGSPLTASLFRPGAVAAGDHGELYVADTFNHRVRIVRPAGTVRR
jgi:DNA-binding beta-propeller fold protein YncE